MTTMTRQTTRPERLRLSSIAFRTREVTMAMHTPVKGLSFAGLAVVSLAIEMRAQATQPGCPIQYNRRLSPASS